MPTRLKPGKKVERFVPSKSHDAKVKYKTGELCVGIEVSPDGLAMFTFRVKGSRTVYRSPVDSHFRESVKWEVASERLKKWRAKEERKAERKAEAKLKRMLRSGRRKKK